MRICLALVLVSWASVARADVTRCSSVDADVSYTATDLQEMDGDTGWFPSGYAAQLRITGIVTGQTRVAMGLSPTGCWPDRMSIAAPGRTQTGLLDSEYGAQLHVYGQIHTSVLGYQIDWSGEIPVPFVPTDLLIAGTTAFDPTLLPGSQQPSISVSDTTSRVRVITTDVLSDIISITGISGGLALYVQGEMSTTYATTSIALGKDVIIASGGSITAETPAGGYGPTLPLSVSAAGTVTYAPGLIFDVAFDVRIFGITVVDYSLASITMPLPSIDRQVTLSGSDVALPLPHLSTTPSGLGFASGATQSLQLHNSGAGPLMIETTSAPAGVTAATTTIAAGADGTVTVTAASPGSIAGDLVLATNDPNHASLAISLSPSSSGQTNDGDGEHAGSAGCATGRGAGALPLLAIAGLVLRRRRRIP